MYIYIRAMSEEQREIRRQLTAKGKQVLRHLIRLILYPYSDCVHHWKREIVSFVTDVDRVKGKNKWPKKTFIKDALAVQNDMIEQVIKVVKDDEEGLTPKDVSVHEVLRAVEYYQDWLATELSSNGIINVYEAYDVMDEMMKSVNYND